MARRTTIRVERVTDEELLVEIEPQLDAFERRYDRRSVELEEAFRTDGELIETNDFHTWQRHYMIWLDAGGPAPLSLVFLPGGNDPDEVGFYLLAWVDRRLGDSQAAYEASNPERWRLRRRSWGWLAADSAEATVISPA